VALDLTSYTVSDSSRAKRESAIILDQADDKSVRMVDYGGTDKWRLTVAIEGLTSAERDTLTDAIEGGDSDTITVDMGTRSYIGYLLPNSLAWQNKDGLARVRFTLVAAEVV
jgi:GTPase